MVSSRVPAGNESMQYNYTINSSSRAYAGNERVEQSCFRMEVILSRVHVGNKSVIAVMPSDFFRFISHVCGKWKVDADVLEVWLVEFHPARMREMKGNTALDDWSLRRSHPARAGNENECNQQLRNFVLSHLARMREIKERKDSTFCHYQYMSRLLCGKLQQKKKSLFSVLFVQNRDFWRTDYQKIHFFFFADSCTSP